MASYERRNQTEIVREIKERERHVLESVRIEGRGPAVRGTYRVEGFNHDGEIAQLWEYETHTK